MTAPAKLYYTEAEVSEYLTSLGLPYSPRYLAKLRIQGGGPEFTKFNGGMVRYQMADVKAWIASRSSRQTSTSDTKN